MRSLLSESVKTIIAALLYYSGACWLYVRWKLRNRAVVLMYHRVLTAAQMEQSFSTDSIVVTPGTFERQMRLLHRWLNPIDPARLLSMLSGETRWIPRSCVVTFDDGWFDNAENALPILAKTRTPGTIFLAAGYVGTTDCFWQEHLTALLYEEWQAHGPSSEIFRDLGANHILKDGSAGVRTQIRHVVTSLKAWPRDDIDRLISRVAVTSTTRPARPSTDRFMSWQDARGMHKSEWITLGSHAYSHTPLTRLMGNDLLDELDRASAIFNKEIGERMRVFAYPNGDHDEHTAAAVRSAGHELAFTTESGLVAPGDDRFRLKRVNISEAGTTSNARFLCRLFGWF